MLDFIIQYWLQFIFGIIVAVLTWCFHKITNEIKHRQAEMDSMKDEMEKARQVDLAILHDRLFQSARYYIQKGEISDAELDNFNKLYYAYHDIRQGNGTGTELHDRVNKLPLKERI